MNRSSYVYVVLLYIIEVLLGKKDTAVDQSVKIVTILVEKKKSKIINRQE